MLNPQIPDDPESLDDESLQELQEELTADFDIGYSIKDSIIPRAVEWWVEVEDLSLFLVLDDVCRYPVFTPSWVSSSLVLWSGACPLACLDKDDDTWLSERFFCPASNAHRFTGEIASPLEDYDMDGEDYDDEDDDDMPLPRGGR